MARRTRWIDTLMSHNVVAGTEVIQSLLGAASSADTQGWTVGRMIGDLYLFSATVAGAWGAHRLDLGAGTFPQEGFAAGVVADPSESTDEPRGGWMFRTRCVVGQNGAGGGFALARCQFDMRAMRKLDGDEFALVLETVLEAGTTFTVRVVGIIRTLVLLP